MDNAPISLLASIGTPKQFSRKELIIKEGTKGDSLFVLVSGRIRIYTEDINEHRFVIGTYDNGVMFGEGSLDGGSRTASVEALCDSECSVVPYTVLRERMMFDPQFSLCLLSELIKRSRSSTQKLKSLALEPVYQRFRKLAEEEAIPRDGYFVIGSDMSQQEIANRLGASRDMVTRILRELVKGGYIQTSRKEITLIRSLPNAW